MSTRYRVRHASSYQYTTPVVTSFHRLHLLPRQAQGQTVESAWLEVVGGGGDEVIVHRPDHFGNVFSRFDVLRPYSELSVVSWSEISVDRSEPDISNSVAWEQAVHDVPADVAEYQFDSRNIRRRQELAAYAAPFFPVGRQLLPAVLDFTQHIFNECTYDPQATDIATPPLTVLQNKRGVCQDFAHLAIASLRSLGIPSAYVSGYLETLPPAGQERLIGADASHAWLAVYDPAVGWVHADPTNGCWVADRHIVTAVGRDFSDVSPVIGIIYGGGQQQLDVAVDVVPEGEWSAHPVVSKFPQQAVGLFE